VSNRYHSNGFLFPPSRYSIGRLFHRSPLEQPEKKTTFNTLETWQDDIRLEGRHINYWWRHRWLCCGESKAKEAFNPMALFLLLEEGERSNAAAANRIGNAGQVWIQGRTAGTVCIGSPEAGALRRQQRTRQMEKEGPSYFRS